MTRIYLDPTVLLLSSPDPAARAEDVLAPGAADAVTLLVEAGFEVLALGAPAAPSGGLPSSVRFSPELPEHLDPSDWYLTGDPYPEYGRPRGGTTVLVGPHRPEGKLPLPRFDMETRDLAATAMEILTREAMA